MQDVDRNNNAAELVQFTAPLQKPDPTPFDAWLSKRVLLAALNAEDGPAFLTVAEFCARVSALRAALADTSAEAA